MIKATLTIAFISFVSSVAATTMTTSDHDAQPEAMPSKPIVGVMTNTIDATGNNVLINNSTIILSKKDLVQLAKAIKEMMTNSKEVGPANALTTEDLFVLLTNSATNPTMLSHVAGIISAARSGNTGALAGHVAGLLSASLPVAPAPEPTPAAVNAPTFDNPKTSV